MPKALVIGTWLMVLRQTVYRKLAQTDLDSGYVAFGSHLPTGAYDYNEVKRMQTRYATRETK